MSAASQAGALVMATAALAEAIRDLGSVPSGHLYAHVMGQMGIAQYEWAIARLKGAGLVAEEAHVLSWVGPKIEVGSWALVMATAALAEAIRDLGSVPSGHLYAHVMGQMGIAQYEWAIARLKGAGLVAEEAHVLSWVGPKIEVGS